jgi:hypothetical protein
MADVYAAAASYTPAWIGLGGVIMGSVISVGANLFFQWRKEHADREREKRERQVELQTAARLIVQENAPYYVAIVLAIANPDRPLPTERKMEAWEKYSPILAANLRYQEWFDVTDSIYVWTARETSPLAALSKVDYAKRVRGSLDNASVALRPYLAPSEPSVWDKPKGQSAPPSSLWRKLGAKFNNFAAKVWR